MSKRIKTIPLERIKSIRLYENTKKLTFPAIVEAEQPDIAVNAAYFNGLWRAEGHVKADGKVLSTETWGAWGYAWDTGPDIRMAQLPADAKSYVSCLDLINPWDGPEAPLSYDVKEIGGNRGRTAIGLGNSGLTVLSIGDGTKDATTPEGVRHILAAKGCDTALELDSGSSSHCYMDGAYILSSRLIVQTVLLIYLWPDKPLYRVQCGAFSVRDNAEKLRNELTKAGFAGFVTEGKA
jgi:hypothetical protein